MAAGYGRINGNPLARLYARDRTSCALNNTRRLMPDNEWVLDDLGSDSPRSVIVNIRSAHTYCSYSDKYIGILEYRRRWYLPDVELLWAYKDSCSHDALTVLASTIHA